MRFFLCWSNGPLECAWDGRRIYLLNNQVARPAGFIGSVRGLLSLGGAIARGRIVWLSAPRPTQIYLAREDFDYIEQKQVVTQAALFEALSLIESVRIGEMQPADLGRGAYRVPVGSMEESQVIGNIVLASSALTDHLKEVGLYDALRPLIDDIEVAIDGAGIPPRVFIEQASKMALRDGVETVTVAVGADGQLTSSIACSSRTLWRAAAAVLSLTATSKEWPQALRFTLTQALSGVRLEEDERERCINAVTDSLRTKND